MKKFPILSRTGGRCDDCKSNTVGTTYIASRNPETDEIEHVVCFVHMKSRQRYLLRSGIHINA